MSVSPRWTEIILAEWLHSITKLSRRFSPSTRREDFSKCQRIKNLQSQRCFSFVWKTFGASVILAPYASQLSQHQGKSASENCETFNKWIGILHILLGSTDFDLSLNKCPSCLCVCMLGYGKNGPLSPPCSFQPDPFLFPFSLPPPTLNIWAHQPREELDFSKLQSAFGPCVRLCFDPFFHGSGSKRSKSGAKWRGRIESLY